MKKLVIVLAPLLIVTLLIVSISCNAEQTTPTATPTPVSSPTPTQEPLPTPTPTPEPITHVFNITRQLSGINIILVMTTWNDNKVDILWRIENPSSQPFKASRLYNIFSPGMYAIDQNGKEAEYFISSPIREDLEQGKPFTYHTQLLFYPESSEITIHLSDIYSEGSTFVDISTEYTIATYYNVTHIETEEFPLNYEVVDSRIDNWWWRISSDCTVTIKNTDTESGYFRIEFNMVTKATDTAPSKIITKAAWQTIEAGKQVDFTVRHEGAYIEDFTYSVTSAIETITTTQ